MWVLFPSEVVEKFGDESPRVLWLIEPRQVSAPVKGMEVAVWNKGGDLSPCGDAAERVVCTPQVEGWLGDRPQLLRRDAVTRHRTPECVYRCHQAQGGGEVVRQMCEPEVALSQGCGLASDRFSRVSGDFQAVERGFQSFRHAGIADEFADSWHRGQPQQERWVGGKHIAWNAEERESGDSFGSGDRQPLAPMSAHRVGNDRHPIESERVEHGCECLDREVMEVNGRVIHPLAKAATGSIDSDDARRFVRL